MDDLRPRKRKGHNQKDDWSKRGTYREIDEDSAQARKALIGSYAEKVIRAPPSNDDKTPPSFFILDIVLFHDDPLAALAIVHSFKNVVSLDRSWTPPPF